MPARLLPLAVAVCVFTNPSNQGDEASCQGLLSACCRMPLPSHLPCSSSNRQKACWPRCCSPPVQQILYSGRQRESCRSKPSSTCISWPALQRATPLRLCLALRRQLPTGRASQRAPPTALLPWAAGRPSGTGASTSGRLSEGAAGHGLSLGCTGAGALTPAAWEPLLQRCSHPHWQHSPSLATCGRAECRVRGVAAACGAVLRASEACAAVAGMHTCLPPPPACPHAWPGCRGHIPGLAAQWERYKGSLAKTWPFEPDVFQKEAIIHMENVRRNEFIFLFYLFLPEGGDHLHGEFQLH